MHSKIINSILKDDLKQAESLSNQDQLGLKMIHKLLKTGRSNPFPLIKLKSKLPGMVNISTSFTCNLGCEMCEAGFRDKPYLFNDRKYLLPEEFNKIFPWLKEAPQIFYSGEGETLDSPHIFDFLKRIKKKTSILVTSGVPLNKKRIRLLIEDQLTFLNLSFDGKSSIGHGAGKKEYIRKFWNKVSKIQGMKKELKTRFPIICMQITVSGENIDNLNDIVEDACRHGIKTIIIIPMTANTKSLFKKSIYVNYEESREKINRITAKWIRKGMTVSILGFFNKLTDSLTKCPFVDNYLDFHTDINFPSICCGSIKMPLEYQGDSINKYWNSFPFRYFRYLHFCNRPADVPLACKTCWILNPRKYSEICLSKFNNNSNKANDLYRKASRLKSENRINRSKEIFSNVLAITSDLSLRGKTYFHLGEMEIMENNRQKALTLMKLAVQYCFDHQKAFAYLYLLLRLKGDKALTNSRGKRKAKISFFNKAMNNR